MTALKEIPYLNTNLNIDLLRKSNSIEKDKINVEDYRKALAILRSVKKNKLELFLSNWYNR